jgi:sterol desaturase/sphingolipid hydroxylase (fatty acid hydroxylase superfamily)
MALHLFIDMPLSILLDRFVEPPTGLPYAHWTWQFPLVFVLTDGFFYFTHRFFHQIPYLYRRVHSAHHKWVHPVAVSALDAHPLEHLIGNVVPFLAPVLIVHMNFQGWLLYSHFVTCNTVVSHSGYKIFGTDHDIHHKRRTVNFGVGFYLFDRLYGTYKFTDPSSNM